MAQHDFLVELGTEELPPKALKTLSNAFTKGITAGLAEAGVSFGEVKSYASPRRLAVLISGLDDKQADREIEKRGPSVKAPEKAVEGFARSCGVTADQLEKIETNKGEYFNFKATEEGKATASLLPALVETSLNKLPIPKRMRWGASRIEFVRPVHWLVMLFGDEVVDCEILGLKSGRKTRGHRFHYNQNIELITPAEYATSLESPGMVIADYEIRKAMINEQVQAEGNKLNAVAQIDEDLLDEVTALNEWPVALTGRFEERFLEVPAQALISSMKEHQKYFHHLDANGNLLPNFTTICNIVSNDPQQVIEGNEKVIRPRLSDAAFFFETDKKTTLESRVEKLKSIVFQKDLGTVHDKASRISALSGKIATALGEDQSKAERAGLLAKTDLLTDMVYEFTDLQGLMGYHYALNDGENNDVALAQNEQYMPRFAGDELPQSAPGIAVAIADRLDTLTGLFGINQPPTGSKDPFALRRAALGVLRIIVERNLDLDLRELLKIAADNHNSLPARDGLEDKVLDFMLERFRAWYEDAGINAEVFLAVLALKPSRPLDFDRRVKAVNHFRSLPEAEALAAANKRVSNILSKQGVTGTAEVDTALLTEAAEKALAAEIEAQKASLAPLFAEGKYQDSLESLSSLRVSVDAFFEDVMVMADDEAVKNNRLALLSQLRALFLGVADISVLG
ncbi:MULTISPECIES: glycine--tRNA ligase subunit beta [unclassified Neptuniibacter]|uniref:glycine--tRNA ligase subunit beta n=1 Tax=unclassified Neptuniibacter TaxID=2630693 RepID=UPI000C61EAA3|nr:MULTISPECIES: glycine--tRNA ligase subunit beta [unclassified Neptuniibacter]MAY42665.1 glycine--tRNA ligase subunit beta [Oceanospirillaceae bacterium]|tara:strand:+ start:41057 stop:43105 length:2049 start_codon:yes stop_codon:yes gene_type:complete